MWKLTNGRAHIADVSDASHTLLFDIRRDARDPEPLDAPHIPASVLPKVFACSHVFGKTDPQWCGAPIPIVGDQQSALFGQRIDASNDIFAPVGRPASALDTLITALGVRLGLVARR